MNLTDYKIILASNSPRRRELLSGIDIEYEVRVMPGIDESYSANIFNDNIAEFVAIKKGRAYLSELKNDELLITSDTIVVLNDLVLGKPVDENDAVRMLGLLSGNTHKVITGVCLISIQKQISFSETALVSFANLSDDEIRYYVSKYKPLDKAGAYGVQEWIGYVGVDRIEGSYFNVMGLPISRLYRELKTF